MRSGVVTVNRIFAVCVLLPALWQGTPRASAGAQPGIGWSETERVLWPHFNENYGADIAAWGDTLAAGVPDHDGECSGCGLVVVYERSPRGDAWVEQQRLIGFGVTDGDAFGTRVSAHEGRILVAAKENTSLLPLGNVGAVYLFERDGTGTWNEVAEFGPEAPAGNEFYGSAVAVGEQRIAIGARGAGRGGEAYILGPDPSGVWVVRAVFAGANPDVQATFGESLALDGDTLAVGDPGTLDLLGAVHLFERDRRGEWSETGLLRSPIGAPGDRFGHRVALDGDTLVVSAGFESTEVSQLYTFERQPDGAWAAGQVLSISRDEGSFSNAPLAFESNRLVVGGSNYNPEFEGGVVYLFERDPEGGSWTQVGLLSPVLEEPGDRFGGSVATISDQVFVGAEEVLFHSGAVSFFTPVRVSPVLDIEGRCPGEITLRARRMTPLSNARIFASRDTGSGVLDEFCPGEAAGLAEPKGVASLEIGEFGRAARSFSLSDAQCGLFLQLLDIASCSAGDVSQLPTP